MKSVKEGLTPIFLVFQMFFLCPFSNWIIYTILSIVSFSVGFWMLVSLLIISPVFVVGPLRIFMGHISFIVRAIAPMLIVTQAYVTHKEQENIFNILHDVDKSFKFNLMLTINYGKLRIKYLTKNALISLILILIRCYFLVHLMYHTDGDFRFYWFHCVQYLLVSKIRCIQTAFYGDILNDRIVLIHEKLAAIEKTKIHSQKILREIICLRKIYAMIYDVSELINYSFGWSMLVITVTFFVDFVTMSYLYLLVVQDIVATDNRIIALVGLVTTLIPLLNLCYSCGRCADNVNFKFNFTIKRYLNFVRNTI